MCKKLCSLTISLAQAFSRTRWRKHYTRLTLRHLEFGRLAQFVRKATLLLNYLEGHLQVFLEFVEPST